MARTKQSSRFSPTRCGCFVFIEYTPHYLPTIKIDVHATILDSISRTVLTQTFVNPSKDSPLEEINYVFPLYDGISVVGFHCTVADRVIKGVVKERQQAQQDFSNAKARGETAGLLQQSLEASDAFTMKLGNVPAGGTVKVEITYLGELKHDAEIDGVRFTIPTHIAPRYGDAASLEYENAWFQEDGISVTVDVEMPEHSVIKSIQSPSHPISVSIGTTSIDPTTEPSLRKASATLSQRSTELNLDVIFQIVATGLGDPAAFIETHSTIPNQRALMTTLVPKFNLPAQKPEIVFICDRSGSMSGSIDNLVDALNIFLKSLPVGIKFNICSFGSDYSFLWPRSKTYSADTLAAATKHVQGFGANFGGTEIYQPMEAVFSKRYKDMNLEVFLLTDGEIWDQERLFDLINQEVVKSNHRIRIFSLGIGSGASSALIEGVARAGNGFAQTVQDAEKMDKKVVRMLKGALFPHITNYNLEIKYEKTGVEDSEIEDFEVIDKVTDALHLTTLEGEDGGQETAKPQQPISLFDSSMKEDDEKDQPAIGSKYDHLPAVAVPQYLQTPFKIPDLYPFNRTTVYVLMSNCTPSLKPKSVLLKGTYEDKPLELEIPIVNLTATSDTIHQLAARNETKELEEGRGWLSSATDRNGRLLKDRFDGMYSDMVEREAVRLGTNFQVAGKWCSFVAIEESTDNSGSNNRSQTGQSEVSTTGKSNSIARMPPLPRRQLASKAARKSAVSNSMGMVRGGKGLGRGAMIRHRKIAGYMESEEAAGNDEDDDDADSALAPVAKRRRGRSRSPMAKSRLLSEADASEQLQELIALQEFAGNWVWHVGLERILGISRIAAMRLALPDALKDLENRNEVMATACAIVFLQQRLKAEKETWEVLVDKAKTWLEAQGCENVEELENIVQCLF